MFQQNSLKPNPKATKRRKRIGRGASRGNYSGKGMKGQTARSGGRRRPGFEGGQTPLIRKMPKLKGFRNPNAVEIQIVNINQLNIFEDGTEVTTELLLKHNLIKNASRPVKLLGNGQLDKKLKILIPHMSKSLAEKLGITTTEKLSKSSNSRKKSTTKKEAADAVTA